MRCRRSVPCLSRRGNPRQHMQVRLGTRRSAPRPSTPRSARTPRELGRSLVRRASTPQQSVFLGGTAAMPSKKRPAPSSRAARAVGASLAAAVLVHGAAAGSVLQQKLFGLPSGLAYYVEVSIGEPVYSSSTGSSASNSFNLLVDTGSANTAVVTADCCSLTNENLYSCSSSSTCVDQDTTASVSYVSGSWSGEIVKDTFSGEGLGEIDSMPFAAITSEDDFIQSGYDGIVGLAYESIASPSSSPPTPYFDVIKSAESLDNTFSLLMCGALQSLALENVSMLNDDYLYAGELLLGGMDGTDGETYYSGEVAYSPLVQEQYYNVIVTDIGVNGESLGLDCQTINSPRSIIDSGTSNIALPSSIYTSVVDKLKTEVAKITTVSDSFFDDDTTCCSDECNPSNANSIIYSLPGISISFAYDDDTSKQITVTIPAEYIWRPIVVSAGTGEVACRVFGISEGSFTLLGDVFMDGLFTVHDRASDRIGLAVAKSCPNGVTSSKNVTVESLSSNEDSFCDCVGSTDRKSSLLASYFPISSKPCFFWLWWMYVVVAAIVVIFIAAAAFGYLHWKRRKLLRELAALQAQPPRVQRQLDSNRLGLDPNLLTTPHPSETAYVSSSNTPPSAGTVALSVQGLRPTRSISGNQRTMQPDVLSASSSSVSSNGNSGGFRPAAGAGVTVEVSTPSAKQRPYYRIGSGSKGKNDPSPFV